KNLLKTGWMIAAALLLLAACEKEESNEEVQDNSIEGIYTGTLSEEGTKSANGFSESMAEATAEVSIVGENEIQVNCYTSDFDTTFMLNYYEHQDNAFVCFTGERFEEMYGHMLGRGHMMGGGMMGDIQNGETEWQHHMDEEHNEGDEHFGGFDMDHHTFTYTFNMMDGDSPYNLMFQGSKQ
ncbi:MAG TPA: hypothetical protein VKA10_06870, partial [Prolixibacteraceae bacterium]|nr:hypothetical protein [Prolixibacteraceae bacterium]